jgi:predicted metalloprotease
MTHEQVRENNRIAARNYRIEVLKMKMKKLKIEPDRRRLKLGLERKERLRAEDALRGRRADDVFATSEDSENSSIDYVYDSGEDNRPPARSIMDMLLTD